MKRTLLILLIGMTAAACVADADAGWLNRREKQRRRPAPQRVATGPSRSLLVGELKDDGRGGWLLDGCPLQLLKDCRFQVAGSPAEKPTPARKAFVLGTRVGDTILAKQIRVRPDATTTSQVDRERFGIVWSAADPNVGVGNTIE